MTNIKSLQSLTEWKLLAGSHEFPGPDGGTCINEAAAVVAGYEYRKIDGAHDFPDCFCPIIGKFTLGLNDSLDDDERQNLIKYVVRLA